MIGDHAVTLTVAFVPLAIVGLAVDRLLLFSVNLAFVGLVAAAFAALVHFGSREHGFTRRQVTVLLALLLGYVAVLAFGVLPRGGG